MTMTSPTSTAVPRPRAPWQPSINVQEEPMRRRTLITATATALGITATQGLLAAPALAAPDRTNEQTAAMNSLNDLSADIWRTNAFYVDPRHAPARPDLVQVMEWQFTQATILTNRVRRLPDHYRRALAVEAEAARSLAAARADHYHYGEATRLYDLAHGAALTGGHHELAAWIACSRAYMPFYVGNHHRALQLCDRALTYLTQADRPGGRAAVCAHSMRARSLAALGDAEGAELALNHAYGAMARYTDAGSANLPNAHHPQRFAWVKLRLQTAEVFAALRNPAEHHRAAEAARNDTSLSAMHRPMLDLGDAECTPDPAAAARTALNVLTDMGTVPNPVLGRARALAARTAARAGHNNDVEALRLFITNYRSN